MSYDRTTEPTRLKQGERIGWTKSFANYGADEYTLQYRFAGPDSTRFVVNASANGTAFDALLTVAADLDVGKYVWQAWLTETATPANTFVVNSGFLYVELGLAAAGTGAVETRSVAKQIVDAIDAAFLASGGGDTVEYEITGPTGSRKVKRSRKDAMEMREFYAKIVASEVQKERVRNGGSAVQTVGVRFYDA